MALYRRPVHRRLPAGLAAYKFDRKSGQTFLLGPAEYCRISDSLLLKFLVFYVRQVLRLLWGL